MRLGFLLCCALLLASCSSSSIGKNSKSMNTNLVAKHNPEDQINKKTLTLWLIETGKRLELLEAAVEQFEIEHPDVEVDLIQFPNDPYKNKLSMAMGKTNQPDVFHSWGGGWLKEFVNDNYVLELTNKLDLNMFIPSALSSATYDNKVYGVPVAITIVPVFYNKEIFEKYNIDVPQTYDKLLTVIDQLNAEKIIPFALANKSKWPGALFFMYLANRVGDQDIFIDAFERSGRGFDDQAFVRAGELIQQLVHRNAFNSDFNKLQFDTGQSRQLMYSGKAAMEIQTGVYINFVRNEAPEFEEKLGIFPFPVVEGGEGKISDIIGNASPVLSISANTKYPEEAIELVKALTSLELAEQLSNETGTISAIQGVQYSDPFTQQLHEMLANATYIQTFYDQSLPASLAEIHKDTTQGLFGLSITPTEAANQMEEMAETLLK